MLSYNNKQLIITLQVSGGNLLPTNGLLYSSTTQLSGNIVQKPENVIKYL